MNKKMASDGFSILELIIIFFVMAMLASIIIFSVAKSREKSNTSRVQIDLKNIATALARLTVDTKQGPGHGSGNVCIHSVAAFGAGATERLLDGSGIVGLETTDGLFSGWSGPYMRKVPLDPWRQNYIFDPDYNCGVFPVTGCENQTGEFQVVHSGGPNKSGINAYDADNIVLILCK